MVWLYWEFDGISARVELPSTPVQLAITGGSSQSEFWLAYGTVSGQLGILRLERLQDGLISYDQVFETVAHDGEITALAYQGSGTLCSGGLDRRILVQDFEISDQGVTLIRTTSLYRQIECQGIKIDGISPSSVRRILEKLAG